MTEAVTVAAMSPVIGKDSVCGVRVEVGFWKGVIEGGELEEGVGDGEGEEGPL